MDKVAKEFSAGAPRRVGFLAAPLRLRESSGSSWEQQFLELLPLVEAIVAFLARRFYLTAADVDDFTSEVFLKLIDEDYAVLRRFRRDSSMKTYLTVTITRLLIDFTNREWGKWRPSAEARRSGQIAILLEKLVVRDEYTFEEAVEILITNHHIHCGRGALEEIVARLPVRPRRRFENDSALARLAAETPSGHGTLLRRERRGAARKLAEALADAVRGLPAQDRLILKMRFEDGSTIAGIAAALRLDARQLYVRVQRLLGELREALLARGIGRAEIDLFLAPGEAE